MKIAIQLAANPRSFKRTYPNFIKNIVDTLNPDIFIHTWRLHGNERPDVITDGSCEEYIELYKPKAWEIEDLYYNYQPLQTMIPHFTSKYKVNEIRKKYQQENNIKYDLIICARPDIRILQEFKMEYAQEVQEDELWIHHFRCGIPSDYIFYGKEKWMNVSYDSYLERDKLNIYQPGSERLWWYKLQKEGFTFEKFKFFGTGYVECDGTVFDRPFAKFDIDQIR